MVSQGRRLRIGARLGEGSFQLSHEVGKAPAADEIRVRVEACSLNYHDYAVATGMLGSRVGLTHLSDAAGIVEAVGDKIKGLAIGDAVVSLFFPCWQRGDIHPGATHIVPGDRG